MLMNPIEDCKKVYPDQRLSVQTGVVVLDHRLIHSNMQMARIVERYRTTMRVYSKNAFVIRIHKVILDFPIMPQFHALFVRLENLQHFAGRKCDRYAPYNQLPAVPCLMDLNPLGLTISA